MAIIARNGLPGQYFNLKKCKKKIRIVWSVLYHQPVGLDIIKPQARCTLARDEIQGRRAALDDINDYVVMICQACGLDKKIRILANADFLAERVRFELTERY